MIKNLPANAGDMGLKLIWEDPACLKAAKLMPQLLTLCSRAGEPQLLLRLLKSVCLRLCPLQEEKSAQ